MTTIRDILLLHHSHTDIGYTNYQDNVFALHRGHIRRALLLAERYAHHAAGEQFKWLCETTVILEDFLRHATSAEVDALQDLHRRGLISFGGLYTNGTPLYTTEMLARTLYTAGRLRREYGFDIRHAINCDVNGQAWGLVEMLLDAGFEGLAMAINRVMAPDPQPRPTGFRWQGTTGRHILTWHGEHYGDGNNLGIPRLPVPFGGRRWWQFNIEGSYPLVQDYIRKLDAKGYAYDFALLQIVHPFMWDNDGPDEALVGFVQEWNARGYTPALKIVGIDELFARIAAQDARHLPVHAGDWNDWWAQGAGSSAFETAVARRAHEKLAAAEALAALLAGQPGVFSYPHGLSEEARRALALYDEHTWGSSESVTHADSPQSRGQWYRKAAYAYEGEAAAARLAQTVGLNFTARLPQPAPESPHVAVFNPLPWPRRWPLLLPRVGRSGLELERLGRDLEVGSPHGTVGPVLDYGLIDLPAGGYALVPVRTSPLEPLPFNPTPPVLVPRLAPEIDATDGVRIHGWTLENRFYKLAVDTQTGAIRSLITRDDGAEWVNDATPWRLGHYVYETLATPRGRIDIQLPNPPADYDYRPHLAPQRRGPHAVTHIEAYQGAGSGRLALTLDADGVNVLHVQVVLYDDLPWIDLIFDLDKQAVSDPESVYIAFPLALRSPDARYETAGAIVQAGAQQLRNASKDFYAVQRWVDLNDGARGVSIATPDAPLLHFGGFTNHKHQPELVMEQPYFVSWPMNNHWWTNFVQKQSGWTRFRYRLLPYQGGFDAARAARLGAEMAAEPLILPVTDRESGLLTRSVDVPQHLPESSGLFTVTPESVAVTGLKPADDGRGIIVRLQEIDGRAASAQLTFTGATLESVEGCNLLEEADGSGGVSADGDAARVEIAPYHLRTVRVLFAAVH